MKSGQGFIGKVAAGETGAVVLQEPASVEGFLAQVDLPGFVDDGNEGERWRREEATSGLAYNHPNNLNQVDAGNDPVPIL